MKKFASLLLATLLLSVFLYAVESEPSAIVGYVVYQCQTGESANNNFVALPMDMGFSDSIEFGEAYQDDIDVISNWLAASQAWESTLYDGDIWTGEIFDVKVNSAYMISIYDAKPFYCVGPLPEAPVYDLVFGATASNNFIMIPLDRTDLEKASELGGDISDVSAVNAWSAPYQSWMSIFYDEVEEAWTGDDFSVSVAMPLMISITKEKEWPNN